MAADDQAFPTQAVFALVGAMEQLPAHAGVTKEQWVATMLLASWGATRRMKSIEDLVTDAVAAANILISQTEP